MSIIRILPEHVSNQIAAGEVIERPASVVKELVENSLDAHAKRIIVRVERAGQRLISVSDDGDGMDPDDALLCFEAHATSKIATEKDISHISSFGFRGEAMPSIASVSKMTIRTRKRDAQEGVQVTVNGGKMIENLPVGCAPGTETVVRDLFFNIPARRKFLKSNATEERHITEIMSLITLAHPDTAFELTIDGRKIISSGGGEDLMPRIRDIYGRDLADAMTKIEFDTGRIQLSGYITKRGITRPSRQEQRIFVNGRPVESLPVYRGIKDGCGPMLDKGRYHPVLLFITLDPAMVDINVHPAKREVRFRNEFELYCAVRDAVAEALKTAARESSPFLTSVPAPAPSQRNFDPEEFLKREAQAPAPEAEQPIRESRENKLIEKTETPAPLPPKGSLERVMLASKVNYRPVGVPFQKPALPDLFQHPEEPAPEEKKEETPASAEVPAGNFSFPGRKNIKILGFLEDTYIVAVMKDSLVLIDQHAAHERVMYEKLMEMRDDTVSQRLLIPVTLDLSRAECRFIEKNLDLFLKLGFEVETFGETTIKLNAIPAVMRQDNAGGVFRDLVSNITQESSVSARLDSSMLAQAACKAAVKAHDKLSLNECDALLDQMALCKLPFCCPHGRPTIINIPLSEIEHRFGRK